MDGPRGVSQRAPGGWQIATVAEIRVETPRVKSFGSRFAFLSVPRTMKSAWLTSPDSVCPWAEQNGQAAAAAGNPSAAAASRRPRR